MGNGSVMGAVSITSSWLEGHQDNTCISKDMISSWWDTSVDRAASNCEVSFGKRKEDKAVLYFTCRYRSLCGQLGSPYFDIRALYCDISTVNEIIRLEF